MKRIIAWIATVFCVLFTNNSFASSRTISWDPVTTYTDGTSVESWKIVTYKIYIGTALGIYDIIIDAGTANSVIVPNFPDGMVTHVTAKAFLNTGEESAYSPEYLKLIGNGLNFSLGVYVKGVWYLEKNTNFKWDGAGQDNIVADFGKGLTGATGITGDWNGSGTSQIGVFYPPNLWYLDYNDTRKYEAPPADRFYHFGFPGVVSVVGDWNGDGRTKIGVYDNNGAWHLDWNGNGQWDGPSIDRYYPNFGKGVAGAIPVAGDWTGSGKWRVGIYANGLWYLDIDGNGAWDPAIDRHYPNFIKVTPNAVPITGDWEGTGLTQIGIYSAGVWYLDLDGNGAWNPAVDLMVPDFGKGVSGAIPVTGIWNTW